MCAWVCVCVPQVFRSPSKIRGGRSPGTGFINYHEPQYGCLDLNPGPLTSALNC